MNFFLVETPFNYINSLEAKNYLDLDDNECYLIVMTAHLKNAIQLSRMIDEGEWGTVVFLNFDLNYLASFTDIPDNQIVRSILGQIKLYFKALHRLKMIVSKYSECGYLISGYYRHKLNIHFSNIIKYREFVLVDDGNMTLFTNDLRKEEKRNNFSSVIAKSSIKNKLGFFLLRKIFGYQTDGIPNITYFTSYDLNTLPFDKYIKNTYSLLTDQAQSKATINKVYFLGAPLLELGVLTANDFEQLFDQIMEYYQVLQLVYFPHRFESIEQIKKIQDKYGVVVVNNELPFELYISNAEVLPECIASYYSSALSSLGTMLGGVVKLDAIYIPNNLIIPRQKASMIERIYEEFLNQKNSPIDVIRL